MSDNRRTLLLLYGRWVLYEEDHMLEFPEVKTVRRGMENVILEKPLKSVQVRCYDLRVKVPEDFG